MTLSPSERGQKYHARRTEYNGRLYASKMEADFAMCLDIYMRVTDPNLRTRVVWWTPQVRFHFPKPWGSHAVDFLVGYAGGGFELIEVKGKETPDGKHRRKALEHYLGFPIRVWGKEGFR